MSHTNTWKRDRSGATRDMIAVVYAQLPRALQGLFEIDVQSDAYYLNAVAWFKDAQGREWSCPLEACEIEGVPVSCQLPELFVAQLCAVA